MSFSPGGHHCRRPFGSTLPRVLEARISAQRRPAQYNSSKLICTVNTPCWCNHDHPMQPSRIRFAMACRWTRLWSSILRSLLTTQHKTQSGRETFPTQMLVSWTPHTKDTHPCHPMRSRLRRCKPRRSMSREEQQWRQRCTSATRPVTRAPLCRPHGNTDSDYI